MTRVGSVDFIAHSSANRIVRQFMEDTAARNNELHLSERVKKKDITLLSATWLKPPPLTHGDSADTDELLSN
jgi:hypothetical protein